MNARMWMCVETCTHPSVTVDTHTVAPLHRHTLMHTQDKQEAERVAIWIATEQKAKAAEVCD